MSVTSALRRLKTSSYDGAPELMVGGGLGALGAGVGSYYGGVKSVRGINDRANALLTELNAPAVDVQLKMDKTTKDLNYLDALEYDLKRDLDRIKAKKQFDLSDFAREQKLMMKIDDVSHQVDKLDAERGLLHKQMNEILPGIEAGSAKITDDAAIAARKAARNWKIGGGLGVAAGLGALGLGLHRLAKNDPYGSLKTSSDNSTGLMVGGGLGALGAGVGSYYGAKKSVRGINDRANALLIELNAPVVEAQSKLDDILSTAKYFGALESDLRRDLKRVQAKNELGIGIPDFLREQELKKKIDDAVRKAENFNNRAKFMRESIPTLRSRLDVVQVMQDAAIEARKAARDWKIGGGLGVAAGLGALGLGLHRIAKNDSYGSSKTSSDNSTGLMVGGGLGALTGIATATKGAEGAGMRAFNQVRMKSIQKDMEALNRLTANDFSGMERLHNEARGMFPIALDNARRATRNWQIGGGLAAAAGLGALGLGIHRLAKNDPNRDAYGS